jgi:putative transposase
MDHYSRRIIGFGIHAGVVNGEALCRMFKQAIRGVTTFPHCLSSDHDPLFRFHQLGMFRDYYNEHRTHSALKGQTPVENPGSKGAHLQHYRWQTHCRGLYQTPIAA